MHFGGILKYNVQEPLVTFEFKCAQSNFYIFIHYMKYMSGNHVCVSNSYKTDTKTRIETGRLEERSPNGLALSENKEGESG